MMVNFSRRDLLYHQFLREDYSKNIKTKIQFDKLIVITKDHFQALLFFHFDYKER